MEDLSSKLLNATTLVKGATNSVVPLKFGDRYNAVVGEIILDDVNLVNGIYPRLMVKVSGTGMNSVFEYIGSAADAYMPYLKSVIINVAENMPANITNETYNGDLMWYAITRDAGGSFNSDAAKKIIYDKIVNNPADYTPYILNVRDNGQSYKLSCFVTEDFVYVDLGKILAGPKDVRSLDKILKYLNDEFIAYVNTFNVNIDNYRAAVDAAKNAIMQINTTQDGRITEVELDITTFRNDVNKLQTDISNYVYRKEDKVKEITYTVGGNATTMYPLLIEYDKTKMQEFIVPGYGVCLHNSPMFLNAVNANYASSVDMGDRTIIESLDPGSWLGRTPYTYSHIKVGTADKTMIPIRDIKQYKFQFVVYVKGGTSLNIASKYIERLKITFNLSSISMGGTTYNARPVTDSINKNIEDGYSVLNHRIEAVDRLVNVKTGITVDDRFVIDIAY